MTHLSIHELVFFGQGQNISSSDSSKEDEISRVEREVTKRVRKEEEAKYKVKLETEMKI